MTSATDSVRRVARELRAGQLSVADAEARLRLLTPEPLSPPAAATARKLYEEELSDAWVAPRGENSLSKLVVPGLPDAEFRRLYDALLTAPEGG